jgi:hypothetical protein
VHIRMYNFEKSYIKFYGLIVGFMRVSIFFSGVPCKNRCSDIIFVHSAIAYKLQISAQNC